MQRLIIRDSGSDAVLVDINLDDTVVLHEGSYYVPTDQVNMDNLEVTVRSERCPYKGVYHWIDLVKDNVRVENVAWIYQDPPEDYAQLRDRIGFYKRNFRGTLVEIVES